MRRFRIGWIALTVGMLLSLAAVAHGQGQPGDPAGRPPLSPWFGLYRKNGGPLDNYHMFVRPQFQLENTLRQQQNAIQRNDAGVRSLGQEMTWQQEQLGMRPTGSGSVFMYYSHYYPGKGQGSQPGLAAAGPRRWAVPRSSSSGRHSMPSSSQR